MTIAQAMVSGFKWTALSRLLTQLASWGFTLLTIRLLTPENYGLMALAASALSFIVLLNELGLGWSLVQKASVGREDSEVLHTFIIVLNMVFYAVAFAAAPHVARFFAAPELTDIFRVLSLTLVILAFAVVPRSLLTRHLRFRAIAIAKSAAGLSAGAATFALAYVGFGTWSLVLGAVLGATIETAGYLVAWRETLRPRFQVSYLRGHLRFGFVILLQRFAWLAYTRADTLIVGRALGTQAAGVYSVGQELASLPLDRIGQVVNQIVFAGFSRLQSDPTSIERYFLRGAGVAALAGFPVFFGMSSVAAPLIEIVIGSKWADAALPLQILALVVPLRMLNALCAETLNALGRAGTALSNVLVAASFVIPSLIVGINWGVMGMSFGWVFGFSAAFAVIVTRFSAVTGISSWNISKVLAGPTLASVLMYAAVYWTTTNAVPIGGPAALQLGCAIVVGVLVYTTSAFLFCQRQIADLRGLLRGRKVAEAPKAEHAKH